MFLIFYDDGIFLYIIVLGSFNDVEKEIRIFLIKNPFL